MSDLLSAYRYWRGYHPRHSAYTATNALEYARRDVAEGKRRYAAKIYPAVTWQAEPGIAHIESPEKAGLRHVGNVEPGSRYSSPWSNSKSCGWYADNDQRDTIMGVVYQLPGRKGHARFVAGYQHNGCDGGPTLDLNNIYSEYVGDYAYRESAQDCDAARTAAAAADSMARHAAEEEREYNAAWQAGNRYADLADEIAGSRDTIKRLLAERKAARAAGLSGFNEICATIRRVVSNALADIQEARELRQKLRDGEYIDEWTPGFYTGDKRLLSAFNEGAGLISH